MISNKKRIKKIAYVSGTRADFGLMLPVLKAIKASKSLDLILYATGEHLMPQLGKTINENDIIVEANKPTQKVLTKDNEEITLKQFAGIKYGSEIFVKKDIVSLLDLSKGE